MKQTFFLEVPVGGTASVPPPSFSRVLHITSACLDLPGDGCMSRVPDSGLSMQWVKLTCMPSSGPYRNKAWALAALSGQSATGYGNPSNVCKSLHLVLHTGATFGASAGPVRKGEHVPPAGAVVHLSGFYDSA